MEIRVVWFDIIETDVLICIRNITANVLTLKRSLANVSPTTSNGITKSNVSNTSRSKRSSSRPSSTFQWKKLLLQLGICLSLLPLLDHHIIQTRNHTRNFVKTKILLTCNNFKGNALLYYPLTYSSFYKEQIDNRQIQKRFSVRTFAIICRVQQKHKTLMTSYWMLRIDRDHPDRDLDGQNRSGRRSGPSPSYLVHNECVDFLKSITW